MGGSSSKQPEAPDPKQLTKAQIGTNIGTAVAQQALNSTNQVTPYGSLNYSVTGSTTYKDPVTGKTYALPQYTQTTTLSPQEQKLYDQQVGLRGGMNTAASGLLNGGGFNAPVDLSRENLGKYITSNYSDDFNKQWDQNRSSLETQLRNKGLQLGSAAYDNALQDFDTRRSNAFDNFQGAMYSNAQNALLGERDQTLQELSQFTGGGQQNYPTFGGTPSAPVSPTNVSGIYQQGFENQLAQYQAEQESSNGLLDAIGSLAGTAFKAIPAGGWTISDDELKTDKRKVGEIEIQTADGDADVPVFTYRMKKDAARKALGPLNALGREGDKALGGGLMQLGVMASDIEDAMPEAVGKLPSGYRAVNYERILRALK